MGEFLAVYFFILWIANVFLCMWLAKQKKRAQDNWCALAVLFSFVATLVLVGAPSRDKPEVLEVKLPNKHL